MELMEKLLGLLNEYTKQSYDDYSFFKYIEPTHSFYISDDGYESYMPEETILSKRFGFISWLIENNKIDEVKLRWKMYQVFEFRYQDVATLENELLMLLSISNSPIEDLILYLK